MKFVIQNQMLSNNRKSFLWGVILSPAVIATSLLIGSWIWKVLGMQDYFASLFLYVVAPITLVIWIFKKNQSFILGIFVGFLIGLILFVLIAPKTLQRYHTLPDRGQGIKMEAVQSLKKS